MKKTNVEKKNHNDLVKNWEDLVLTYRKLCEQPTFKVACWLVKLLVKLCFRIMLKKLVEEFFDSM